MPLRIKSRTIARSLAATILAVVVVAWGRYQHASEDTRQTAAPVQSTVSTAVKKHPAETPQEDSPDLASTTVLEELRLLKLEGGYTELADFGRNRFLVIAFLGTECPLARAYGQKLNEFFAELSNQNVALLGVFPNIQDSVEDIRKLQEELDLKFPLFKDEANVLADRLLAERTPEVFVLDEERRVRYRGRIDDEYGIRGGTNYQKHYQVSRDLLDAMDDLMAGHSVRLARTDAIGCLIGRVPEKQEHPEVTWCDQIVRLVQERCQHCHRPGEIGPFSLLDYEDAVGWAAMMNEVVQQERMPPWSANPAYGKFSNDPSLTDEQKQLFLHWYEAGAPYGDPEMLPPPREFHDGWKIANPDLVVPIQEEPFVVPADDTLEYQYFVVPSDLEEDRWISQLEVRPDAKSVVHHVTVFIKPKGNFAALRRLGKVRELIGWVPGIDYSEEIQSTDQQLDDESQNNSTTEQNSNEEVGGILLPANSDFVFEMHYTGQGVATPDRTSIAMNFGKPPTENFEDLDPSNSADRDQPGDSGMAQIGMQIAEWMKASVSQIVVEDPANLPYQKQIEAFLKRPLVTTNLVLNEYNFAIPPFDGHHEVTSSLLITRPTLLTHLHAHMHWRGDGYRFVAQFPNGHDEILLDIPKYDFDWQHVYLLESPRFLPIGTRVEVTAVFDNSSDNFRNPDPKSFVPYGEMTWQEMMSGTLYVIQAVEMNDQLGTQSWKELQKHYISVESVAPNQVPEFYNRRGRFLLEMNLGLEALADFDRAIDQQPERIEYRIGRADALSLLNRHHQALAAYQQALDIDPKNLQALLGAGLSAFSLQQFETAYEYYSAALEAAPNKAEPLLQMAELWTQSGDQLQALTYLDRLLQEVNPYHIEGSFVAAVIAFENGQSERGVAILDQLVGSWQNLEDEADTLLAEVALKREQPEKAIEYLWTAIEHGSNESKTFHMLSQLLVEQHHFDEAIDVCKRWSVAFPELGDPHFQLALIYREQDETTSEVEALQTALSLEENHLPTLREFAWLRATHPSASIRNGSEAVEFAERLLALKPTPEPLDWQAIAAARAEAGGFDQAIKSQLKALEQAHQSSDPELIQQLQKNLERLQSHRPIRQ